MHCLVLGDKGLRQGSHFCEGISQEFVKQGLEVTFIGVDDIKKILTEKRFALHRYKKVPFRLARFEPEKDNIDLIFIDQCDFEWLNDVKTPVFYNHKYVHRRFSVFYPDIAFFLTKPLMEYSESINSPYEFLLTKYKYVMPSTTELDTYKPEEKIYEGISWFGGRNSVEMAIEHIDLMGIAQRELYRRDEKILRELSLEGNNEVKINMFETPIPTLKYRELLPKCEAHHFQIPRGQFITRMMFESMACKTLCIFKVHSEQHREILKDLGFVSGEHYIEIESVSKIKEAYLNTPNREEIIENAYNIILERHTYAPRAKFILEVYNNLYGEKKHGNI